MFSAISGNVVRGAVLCDRYCDGAADRSCSCAAEAEKRDSVDGGGAALLSVCLFGKKENFMLLLLC
jgi:hypothetical protein